MTFELYFDIIVCRVMITISVALPQCCSYLALQSFLALQSGDTNRYTPLHRPIPWFQHHPTRLTCHTMCFSIPRLHRNPFSRLPLWGWWEHDQVTPFFSRPTLLTGCQGQWLFVIVLHAFGGSFFFSFFVVAYSRGSLLIGSFYKWVRWPSRRLCGINAAVCLRWVTCKIKLLLVCNGGFSIQLTKTWHGWLWC